MLVNFYSSKTPITVFSLPLLIGLLAVPIFIMPQEGSNHYWNWHNILDEMVRKEAWINFVSTVLAVSITAHRINYMFNRNSFFSKATALPGVIYILCLFSLNQLNFSPVLIAHLFMVLALGKFLKIRRQEGAKSIMFWGGFFLGISILFSTFSVVLILLPLICLIIFRPFVWREWFLVIFGFLLPLFYYLGILYMVKGGLYFDVAAPSVITKLKLDLYSASAIGIFGIAIIISVYKYFIVMRSEVIRFKKQSLVIIHFIWISTVTCFVGYYFFEYIYLSFLIPLSILIGTAFLHAKRTSLVNLFVIIWLIISGVNIFLVR